MQLLPKSKLKAKFAARTCGFLGRGASMAAGIHLLSRKQDILAATGGAAATTRLTFANPFKGRPTTTGWWSCSCLPAHCLVLPIGLPPHANKPIAQALVVCNSPMWDTHSLQILQSYGPATSCQRRPKVLCCAKRGHAGVGSTACDSCTRLGGRTAAESSSEAVERHRSTRKPTSNVSCVRSIKTTIYLST